MNIYKEIVKTFDKELSIKFICVPLKDFSEKDISNDIKRKLNTYPEIACESVNKIKDGYEVKMIIYVEEQNEKINRAQALIENCGYFRKVKKG